MLLNTEVYEQARQARDPHFDGRIYVAVLTTGIYCRPVCPVRVPKKENVRIYASAAAAAEAGFRPCLRCRPESAPGTPAWLGASHNLARALQLISRAFLDDGDVEALAKELGISSRQLTRLFNQHLGVSPAALARTQRLHFAKKLIDETRLPMSEVCFAAGFSSVRRFNAAFHDTYQRSPNSLRKMKQNNRGQSNLFDQSNAERGAQAISLELRYRPPFAWRTMLAFLAYRAIPGVEKITHDSYSRTLIINDIPGLIYLQFNANENTATLHVSAQLTRHLYQIVQRVRQMFDLNAVSADIEEHLGCDPLLQSIVEKYPGVRVPVAWDGFEVAVRAVLGQQVSVRAATTLVARLVKACGLACDFADADLHTLFPGPAVVSNADLSGLGITMNRIAAIQQLAAITASGELRFDGSTSTEEFIQQITQIKGIGAWTAQYIALRALGDPDAFPDSDLILLRAAASPGEILKPADLRNKAEKWRPWRAYAVMFLWHDYTQRANP